MTLRALLLAILLLPGAQSPEVRVAQLMARMNVRQKVAQLFMLPVTTDRITPALAAALEDYAPGAVALFNQGAQSPAEMIAFTNALQETAAASGAGVPLLVAADQEGWPITRLQNGFTIFPNNMVLAAAENGRYAASIAQAAAAEMRAVGLNMNLAPVADVNNNPGNPVIGTRSFGSDPIAVGQMAAAVLQGIQSQGIIATAKHFPGHGDTIIDSHEAMPLVQRAYTELERVEFVPFQAAVDAGVEAVMTAHVAYPAFDPVLADLGLPATFSPGIVTGLLREQMGFEGVILTDSMLMGAVTAHYTPEEAALLAFNAGVDMLAYGAPIENGQFAPVDYPRITATIDHLAGLVGQGEISMERLDRSVRRVLMLKARYGVLDWAPLPPENAAQVGTVFNQSLVETVAQQAVTLVRDDARLLPLAPGARVVMAYPEDAAPWVSEKAPPEAALVPVRLDTPRWQIDNARAQVRQGEPVVVFTCEARGYPGQVDLVNAFTPERTIVVALCSPYDLMQFPNVSTYIAVYWERPPAAAGAMRVLYGEAQAAGRLPVTIPPYAVRHSFYDALATPVPTVEQNVPTPVLGPTTSP